MKSEPFVTVCDLGLHVRVGSEGFGSACHHPLSGGTYALSPVPPLFVPAVQSLDTRLLCCSVSFVPVCCPECAFSSGLRCHSRPCCLLGCCTSACGSVLASSPVLHSPGCQPQGSPSCSHELPGSVFSQVHSSGIYGTPAKCPEGLATSSVSQSCATEGPQPRSCISVPREVPEQQPAGLDLTSWRGWRGAACIVAGGKEETQMWSGR